MSERFVAAGVVTRIAVVSYLRGRDGGPVPLGELARRFGMGERAMRDLVEQIAASGTDELDPTTFFDIDHEALERGEVVVTHFVAFEEPPLLGSAERAALIAGLRMLASLEEADDRAAIAAVIEKLGGAGGIEAVPDDALEPDGALLAQAIRERRRVRFAYRSQTSGDRLRTVDPVELRLLDQEPFLSAWCCDARAARVFRLDRMRELELLDEAAAPHPELEGRPVFRPSGEELAVTLRVDASALPQAIEFLPEGARAPDPARSGPHELEARFARVSRAARLAAEHAERIEVLAPAEAREAAAEWARRGLEGYGAAASGG